MNEGIICPCSKALPGAESRRVKLGDSVVGVGLGVEELDWERKGAGGEDASGELEADVDDPKSLEILSRRRCRLFSSRLLNVSYGTPASAKRLRWSCVGGPARRRIRL